MKNILKITLVMLSTLSFGLAQAGELTVTGSVKSTYSVISSDSTTASQESGKGLGVENDFTFGASGENDFGTWAYATDFDGGTSLDDTKVTLTTSYGTFGVMISEGGLDTDNAASQSVYSRPSDTSYNEGMWDTFDLSGSNTLQYHMPADWLPFGIVPKIAFAPANSSASAVNDANSSGTANAGGFTPTTNGFNATTAIFGQTAQMGRSAFHYQVKANPMTGLNLGMDYVDFKDVSATNTLGLKQKPESGNAYVTYAIGNATLGYSRSGTAFAVDQASDTIVESVLGEKMSIAYNVNDALSISYEEEDSQMNMTDSAAVEMTAKGMQAAYTMGGMTMAIAQNKYSNARYTNLSDVKDTVFSVAMDF